MYYYRDILGANIRQLDEKINKSGDQKYINMIRVEDNLSQDFLEKK